MRYYILSGKEMFMKKVTLVSVAILFLFLFAASADAQEQENITITTYYPSPYGAYKTLRLFPSDAFTPGGSCDKAGEMSYNADKNQVYVCNGINWVGLGGDTFSRFEVFDMSGTFTVPDAVSRIMVEVWGGGGGGAWADKHEGKNVCSGGGAGGAGGYGKGIFNVQPGDRYDVVVGAGGVGGQNGLPGGNSSFADKIIANGGSGGVFPRLYTTITITGAGVAGGCATVNYNSNEGESGEAVCGSNGQNGAYNYKYYYGANGGVGGTAARGGGHGRAPGGGGSGDSAFMSSFPPGGVHSPESGGAGRVIVWY